MLGVGQLFFQYRFSSFLALTEGQQAQPTQAHEPQYAIIQAP